MKTALYLIPVTLGETEIDRVLPSYNREVILSIRHFVVEDLRSARRFLKKTDREINIDNLTFYELNQHTPPEIIESFLKPLMQGESVGVISEAGCPAIADPGADVVRLAQANGFTVIPLVGPSSILMSLMASGFNGQSFAFHGYLPIEATERVKMIHKLEARAYSEDQTQIFIETPYRNEKMLEDMIRNCRQETKLCVAANISCEDEWIVTKRIKAWASKKMEIGKRPCIFLIYKG